MRLILKLNTIELSQTSDRPWKSLLLYFDHNYFVIPRRFQFDSKDKSDFRVSIDQPKAKLVVLLIEEIIKNLHVRKKSLKIPHKLTAEQNIKR